MYTEPSVAGAQRSRRFPGRRLALAVAGAVVLGTSVEAQSSPRRTENGVSRAQKARMSRAAAANAARSTPAKLPMGADSVRRPAPTTSSVSFASFLHAMSDAPNISTRFVRAHTLRPEQVTLVDIRNVFRLTDDQRQFESALQEHDRKLAAMRATLQASTMLRDLLYARQLSIAQVVAIELSPDGKSSVIYYRPD